MGKSSTSKVLEKTKLYSVHLIIWAGFVGRVLRLSSIFRTQGTGEKELGTGVPHVFQGNNMMILLKIVGIWRDNETVSCTKQHIISGIYHHMTIILYSISSISQYIAVYPKD